jgi:methionyl-tRNA formyltransferase
VKRIYDFIRGLSPYPAAWCELTDATGEAVAVKVFETEKIQETHQLVPGTIVTDGKNYLKIAATDGFVGILTLQLPGKKRLRTDELLRGYKIDKTALMR